jgi:hypothetical protein
MKKLIQTIPPFLWSFVSLIPLIVFLSVPKEILPVEVLNYLSIATYLCYALWTSSLVEYMCHEAKSMKYRVLVHVTTALIVIVEILHKFYPSEPSPDIKFELPVSLLSLILIVFNSFIVVQIVKRVFYARSTWFVFLELVSIPIGMFTLSSEVQNWEHEKKSNQNNM